ncbi:MAG TPA: hypothetical protein VMP11_12675 [Verrucomicrobiae bacterium]|nr:hypothetical protein [Verrucomicrobiae bacterium]
MQNRVIVSGIAAFALVAGLVINATAKGNEKAEKSLSLTDVPPAVQTAIKQFAGTNPILKIKQESEDGKDFFAAKVTINGVKQGIEVAPDGTVLATEKYISLVDAPAAVQTAIKQWAGAGSIDSVTEETEGGKKGYEARATVNGQKKEADISVDGKVSEEQDKGESKEGGRDKD